MSRKQHYTEDQYEEDELTPEEEENYEEEEYEDEYDDAPASEEGLSEQEMLDEQDVEETAENEIKFIRRAIALLRNEIKQNTEQKGRLIGGVKAGCAVVDADRCLRMLDNIEEAMPSAVKRGAWVYQRNEEIINGAKDTAKRQLAMQEMSRKRLEERQNELMDKREKASQERAEQIIEEAQRKADNMVRQGIIESRVEDEIKSMRAHAQAEADDILTQAEDDSYDALDRVSKLLTKVLKDINGELKKFSDN